MAAAAAERKHVRAVVVDHGLQSGSAEVAARAAEQARSLGVPAEVVRVDVAPGAPGAAGAAGAARAAGAIRPVGLEAAAREARYAALFAAASAAAAAASGAAAAAASGAAAHSGDAITTAPEVWVAHTADDQAETLLLGAMRGNPAGMGSVEKRPGGLLVRPFLQIRRADTVGACEELGLEYWRDPMNDDPAYRRVAMRQQIIPALTDLLGGDAVPALAATADRIAEDRQLLDALVNLEPTDDCTELAADAGPVRRRRIAAGLLEKGVPVQGDQLAAIERLVTDWRGQGPVSVAGGSVARRDGRLVVER
ncbi:ATP-binding protein [Corynebacterium aquatimens]|uniref:ATP-binding protein n=1 Tax=Corynebacterium aquatimens TaxID=1190508 RepID=UPI00253FDAB6|nr:ATP-binding protein [Corynebacterium aquatimens]